MNRKACWAALVVILAFAAWLRVRGLGFGLPAVYNPDEVAIMSRALAFAKGDLNPHNFLYPTLYFYLLFGWIGLSFVAGYVAGAIPSAAAFQQSFFLDPSGIYLAGRLLGVVCGTVAILVTWLIGRRLHGTAAGLAAALLLAVSPFAVRDAHYVKHDVPTTLLIALAVMAMLPLVERSPARPRTRRMVLAAALTGLACSMHYYAVFLVVPLALSIWFGWAGSAVGDRAKRLVVAAAVVTAAFFAGSPFLLLEPGTAIRDIRANREIVVDRAVETSGTAFASATDYAEMLWRDAVGWPVIVLAVAGGALLARRYPRRLLVVVAFPLAFLLFISNTVAATRYLNPVLPFIAVLAGVAVAAVAERLRTTTLQTVVAVGLCTVAAVPGLRQSWRTGSFFREADTRTLARAFIEQHVPPGTGVLIQPYSVPLMQSREGLVEALSARLGDPSSASTKFQIQLGLRTWPAPAYRTIYLGRGGLDADKIYVDYAELGGNRGLQRLEDLGIRFVVLKRYNSDPPVMAPLVAALEQEARRVAVFGPYDPANPSAGDVEPFLHNTDARLDAALFRPGPVIEIWQL